MKRCIVSTALVFGLMLGAAGGARAINQSGFTPVELAKQIQAMAQHPHSLANAAHAAWNCGYPAAASDLADLVAGHGGRRLEDVFLEIMQGAAPAASVEGRP